MDRRPSKKLDVAFTIDSSEAQTMCQRGVFHNCHSCCVTFSSVDSKILMPEIITLQAVSTKNNISKL
jgi:hypothetical protein